MRSSDNQPQPADVDAEAARAIVAEAQRRQLPRRRERERHDHRDDTNPEYLFLTARHREALSSLEYGITAGTGVTVLVGEAGTGKTTLIRTTLESQQAPKTQGRVSEQPDADAV